MAGEIPPLLASLNVAIGGAAGAVPRYHVGRVVTNLAPRASGFPWGTLAVNVAGSLLMGALIGWTARGTLSQAGAESAQLLIGVGLLSGFTTFSAFSAELVTMLHRGQIVLAAGYVAVSVAAGVGAVLAGLIAAQSVGAS
jgi:CrcB protein